MEEGESSVSDISKLLYRNGCEYDNVHILLMHIVSSMFDLCFAFVCLAILLHF